MPYIATPYFSGDYQDIDGKPSIPISTGDLINNVGFVTEPSLSGYSTSGDLVGFVTTGALTGYATEGYVDSNISNKISEDLAIAYSIAL